MNILIVKRLINRYGTAKCFNRTLIGLIFVNGCYPVLAMLMRRGRGLTLLVKMIVVFQLLMSLGVWMTFCKLIIPFL